MANAGGTFSLFQPVKALTERKFFLLFIFLLGSLLLYPYAESSAFGFYAFRVLNAATIVFCVYAASFRRSLVIAAIVLAVPASVHVFRDLSVNPSFFSVFNIVLSLTFDVLIVVVIFRRVFSRSEPDSETIYGALCIYLLMGFGFASIYAMVAQLQTRAFYLDPLTNPHVRPDRLDFIYYSFATMTSLGAVGMIPATGEARCVSVIEAIVGVLYLAVLISRLIAAYRPTS